MSSNHPNNNHKKPSLHLRRRLLQWGLAGGALVGVGKLSEPWWGSFFKPSPTLYTYAGHPSGVSSVAWSPDGARIASVGWDSTIQVWKASTGQHLLTYRGHPDAATVSWSPDITHLASAGTESTYTIQVWNASTGQQLWTHQNTSTGTPSWGIVAWSPNGKQIATFGSDKSGPIQVRNALDGHLLLNYTGHPSAVSFAWSPDSTQMVSGGFTRSVQVWRAHDGQNVWSYQIPDAYGEDVSSVNAVTWSPDGTRIASGGSCPSILFATNGGIQMWDASTGRKTMNYGGHDGRSDIRAIAWSPDGKHLASGATDNTVQVWSATTGKTSFTYREHTDEVRTVAWSPDGTRIVSGGADRVVRVWKVL